MTAPQARYSSEEFARRGTKLYEKQIRPQVEKNNIGRVVAIDIETGAFEVADDTITASDLFLAHHPQAQTWFVRIGHRGVHRFGPRSLTKLRCLCTLSRRPHLAEHPHL